EIRAAFDAAVVALKNSGAVIVDVDLPHSSHAIPVYYLVATAEASANLARYDGVRFGTRAAGDSSLNKMYDATRGRGFGAEVKRRIMLGTYVLSAGYYDAYYRKAQRVRTLIKQDFDTAFQSVDAIAVPTSPTPAFKLGEKAADPLAMYLADIYTLPASLAGIAGLSVPCGLSPKNGAQPALPVGLQLLGPAFAEERLFTLAAAVEKLSAPNGPLRPSA
ncbi:MAG TPA: amidase family protein, partial [Polyangiaceae bacterium]